MRRVFPATGAMIGLSLLVVLLWLLIIPPLSAPPVEGYDPLKMRLYYASLPRLALAALAGFALALAGALFQQVLRNPLASPMTLGISAGAHLALVVATLYFPDLLGAGRDLIALVGSGLVATLIMILGARRGFSPLSLVLSGLVVSLWCGALAAILSYLNDRSMTSLFIWGAGSLSTLSWDLPLSLGWKIGVLTLASLMLMRPLSLRDLGEETASALGLRLAHLRAAALAIAVALSAMVTSAVGVIGFIGLMAPVLARLMGARRVPHLLAASALIGAWLLLVTDAALQLVRPLTPCSVLFRLSWIGGAMSWQGSHVKTILQSSVILIIK